MFLSRIYLFEISNPALPNENKSNKNAIFNRKRQPHIETAEAKYGIFMSIFSAIKSRREENNHKNGDVRDWKKKWICTLIGKLSTPERANICLLAIRCVLWRSLLTGGREFKHSLWSNADGLYLHLSILFFSFRASNFLSIYFVLLTAYLCCFVSQVFLIDSGRWSSQWFAMALTLLR